MGILDLFLSKKRTEEITNALIGAYAVSRMNDDQRQVIIIEVYRIIREGSPFRVSYSEAVDKFNSSPAIVQAGFMANAMIDLRIHHGIPGYQWDYIPNPFALTVYTERNLRAAISNIRQYGFDIGDCFAGPKEI
jgi:hypothetical protein